jgi:uncharacterized membrane protein YgcG
MFKMTKLSMMILSLVFSYSLSFEAEAKKPKKKSRIKSTAVFTATEADMANFDSMVGAMRSARAKERTSLKSKGLDNANQRVMDAFIKQEEKSIQRNLKQASQGGGSGGSSGGGSSNSGSGNSNAGGNSGGQGHGPGGVSDLHKKIKKTKGNSEGKGKGNN